MKEKCHSRWQQKVFWLNVNEMDMYRLDIFKSSCQTEALYIDGLLINGLTMWSATWLDPCTSLVSWITTERDKRNMYNFWILEYKSNSSLWKASAGTCSLISVSLLNASYPYQWEYIVFKCSLFLIGTFKKLYTTTITRQHMTLPALLCPAYKRHNLFWPFWMYVTVS